MNVSPAVWWIYISKFLTIPWIHALSPSISNTTRSDYFNMFYSVAVNLSGQCSMFLILKLLIEHSVIITIRKIYNETYPRSVSPKYHSIYQQILGPIVTRYLPNLFITS